AHNGTVGNERADALAKPAAIKDQIDTEFGPSKTQVRYRGKVLLTTTWQERWNNSANGSWAKKFFKEVTIGYTVTSTIIKVEKSRSIWCASRETIRQRRRLSMW
ncbi:hypothetical protein AVEN_88107-1, partial [Araneus ventricosus]